MESHRPTDAAAESSDDLSALAWVHEELRKSLEAAHKALRRFVKEAEAMSGSDVDAVDPSVLRTARAQIHQGVGALELVGLPAAATMLRACEAAVQRYVAKPHKLTIAIVDDLERASFALLDYLNRALVGKSVSPLAMFPQYRAVQEAAGAERVHPADLWTVDWQWREIPQAGAAATARQPNEETRQALEQQMLAMMRGNVHVTAVRMSDLCADLAAGTNQLQISSMWRLAAAVFEAQALDLLPNDVFLKRVGSRLLSQLRSFERAEGEVSERLAQDLLFFCAQANTPASANQAPRLAAVRKAHKLSRYIPVDYTASQLGKYDPAWVVQARKRVAAAKESWSAVAGGEMHRIGGLAEQFSLVGESLRRLFPGSGDALATELQQAVAYAQHASGAPSAPLAMEVATALLYVEASLEDAEFDNDEQRARVVRLAERISEVRRGATPQPLEGWMEDLYRRVSDRQTMGSVVQELRATLSEVEKSIDQFFRNPAERQVLVPVPQQMSSMRGVLSVLGMDQASVALLRMRDDVDHLAAHEIDIAKIHEAGTFDRLAGNLGALGFLIDMLSVQPQMAKSLFVYDPAAGTLSPLMGRSKPTLIEAQVEPRLIEQAQMLAFTAMREDVPVEEVARDLQRLSTEAEAADQPELAAKVQQVQAALEQAPDEEAQASVRGELSEALVDFVVSTSEPMGLMEEPRASAPAPLSKISPAAPEAIAELGEDDEMREIFLEEAREVMQDAKAAVAQLADTPDDVATITTLRRAYHTLKGSSRMVGLKTFGDAAWACEQLYNTRLASQSPADVPLQEFTSWSLDYLGGWIEDISAKRDGGRKASVVEEAVAVLESKAAAAAAIKAEADAEMPPLPDVEVLAQAAPALEPIALALPELPTMPDLLPIVERAAESFDDLPVIELDLSKFDSLESGTPAAAKGAEPSAVREASSEPEIQRTLPIPFEGASADFANSLQGLDLDLSGDTSRASLIESLEPSEGSADSIDFALPDVSEAPAEPTPSTYAEEEQVKVVGPLRISIPLFNIFLTEADELSRRLTTEVAEWALELHRPAGETAIALAHSLAGSSSTVGFTELSQLARALEHALMRSHAIGSGTVEEGQLFVAVAEEIRRLLHQFAAGFLKSPQSELMAQLSAHEISSARRLEAASAAAEFNVSGPGEPEPPPPMLGEDEMIVVGELDAPVPAVDLALTEPVPSEPASTVPSVDLDPQVTGFDALGMPELKPFEPLQTQTLRAATHVREVVEGEEDIDAVDAVDVELFPIFEEEGQELMPQLASQLRDWAADPSDKRHASAAMRTLHTLKGGARLAGAMRLGEMAHRLESRIEKLLALESPPAHDVEALESGGDALSMTFEALRARDHSAYQEAVAAAEMAVAPEVIEPISLAPMAVEEPPVPLPAPVVSIARAEEPVAPQVESQLPSLQPASTMQPDLPVAAEFESLPEPQAQPQLEPTVDAPPAASAPLGEIDWNRFAGHGPSTRRTGGDRPLANQAAVRVRAPLLDRLVNHAGEVSITRSRIESEVTQIKGSLGDLTDNLERLRQQLRDIELQAETQMSSRLEQAKAASQTFDPLEFDRFTRFQELTRMMAESVNDVATVQRALQRTLETTEDELVAQARLTREMQDDLLRTRMVEFESMSDRLYRVVRQAAKETGKQVRLDIVGGSIEVDRGVLDRMTGAFEHLLRNSVTHGVESPDKRVAAGKEPSGSIVVSLTHEGNEVGVEFRDDGAGLDLARIRAKGLAMGLLDANAQPSDAELANLIFMPGFSTADKVTELAGRGVGMDVVRSEVNAMGGRIETATSAGQGTSFKLVLPLTTAVTQVVMVRIDTMTIAIPSTLIEIVRRATVTEVAEAYETGHFTFGDRALPFFWLGALLHLSARSIEAAARTRQVLIIRSAQQRVALHVDEVLGNQEVVVKNLGPQLSRIPGLAGMTLLASGAVSLIYNPVALATLYGGDARSAMHAAVSSAAVVQPDVVMPIVAEASPPASPLILVVDDSLTVRRVTQRLLVREGYRVTLAKDGLDALERLAEEKPQMVLSDIEMPRMDGFDLVRNIRADARLRDLPVVMITSRIAQKHRDYAAELGVDHYLGKPYSEEDLLALIGRYTAATTAV